MWPGDTVCGPCPRTPAPVASRVRSSPAGPEAEARAGGGERSRNQRCSAAPSTHGHSSTSQFRIGRPRRPHLAPPPRAGLSRVPAEGRGSASGAADERQPTLSGIVWVHPLPSRLLVAPGPAPPGPQTPHTAGAAAARRPQPRPSARPSPGPAFLFSHSPLPFSASPPAPASQLGAEVPLRAQTGGAQVTLRLVNYISQNPKHLLTSLGGLEGEARCPTRSMRIPS